MILVGLLLIVGGIAYLLSPWVRQKVDGVKTYFLGVLVALGPVLDWLNVDQLQVALNLSNQWKAIVAIVLGLGIVWVRMLTNKPGVLAKK